MTNVRNPTVERVLFVTRDRKCHSFRGQGEENRFDWIEEMQASLQVRHLPPIEQALFIIEHLEGAAKKEIKYRPGGEREDPKQIFAILQELYGLYQVLYYPARSFLLS